MWSDRAGAPASRPGFSRSALLVGLAGASFLYSLPSQACGPCTVPELWGVEVLGGEPIVVTNFGLLSQTDSGWRLTCEEAIGGLLLDARGDENASLVSTEVGFFEQTGDICDWGAGPAVDKNTWAWRFSLASVESGQARESFALVIDQETQEVQVERSTDGGNFSVIHTFGNVSGYRYLVAAGDPAAVFVTGYTLNPRTWNVAFSLDSGQTWGEVSPPVDNDYATMVPRLVDPEAPRTLLFQAETTAGEGQELWRFDAEEESVNRVLKMEPGEIYGGMALSGDTLWVAGRRRANGASEVGSLYRANRDELDFARVVDDGPPFWCLDALDGDLFACVNEFSRDSPFVLGRSTDEGQTWEPYVTVEDLGRLESCGDVCCATLQWLQGDYGVNGSAGAGAEKSCADSPTGGTSSAGNVGGNVGSGGNGNDGGLGGSAGEGEDAGTAGASSEPEPSRRGGGGGSGCRCSTEPSRDRHPLLLTGLLAVWLLRRRRYRPEARRGARIATLIAMLSPCACSNGSVGPEAEPAGAAGAPNGDGEHDANCRELGADLNDFHIETEGGIGLTFVEHSPDPPAVGDNSWVVDISDAGGDPLTGLGDSIFVTPFMPQHGHGTPVSVGVVETGDGEYRLSPVNTFMPGLWQITLEIDAGDNPEVAEFQVCVE